MPSESTDDPAFALEQVRTGPHSYEVRLHGELGFEESAQLWKGLRGLLSRRRRRQSVHFDLEDVTRLDGAAAALLSHARTELRRRRIESEFINARGSVVEIIALFDSDGPVPPRPRRRARGALDQLGRASVDAQGALHARPMSVADIDDDGSLWFATRFDSQKTEEILDDSRHAVVMQGMASFVSITGSVEVVIDRKDEVESLWKELWRPWFPGGHEDPDLALLRVTVEDAEFWDDRGMAGVRYVLHAIKHFIKRERMGDEADGGDHQRAARWSSRG